MDHDGRRRFLSGAFGASALVMAACARRGIGESEGNEDVTPPEDLMREHGALNRILLIYEENARRLDGDTHAGAARMDVLSKGADLVRSFIEHYHEQLEEDYVFPRLERANRLKDLVGTLRRQHRAGRAVTDTILGLSTAATLDSESSKKKLADALRSFSRMYRPHEAREDTVVLPVFRGLCTPDVLRDLGEQFEHREHELFGTAGFDGIVTQIGTLEQSMGLYDLNQFTPA